jgi:hypothetical protein
MMTAIGPIWVVYWATILRGGLHNMPASVNGFTEAVAL